MLGHYTTPPEPSDGNKRATSLSTFDRQSELLGHSTPHSAVWAGPKSCRQNVRHPLLQCWVAGMGGASACVTMLVTVPSSETQGDA